MDVINKMPPKIRNDIISKRMAGMPKDVTALENATSSLDQMLDSAKSILNDPALSAATGGMSLAT